MHQHLLPGRQRRWTPRCLNVTAYSGNEALPLTDPSDEVPLLLFRWANFRKVTAKQTNFPTNLRRDGPSRTRAEKPDASNVQLTDL